jgi:hypothetical protein
MEIFKVELTGLIIENTHQKKSETFESAGV